MAQWCFDGPASWTLDWEGYLFNEYALKRIPFSNLAVCLVFQVSTSFSSKDTWEADEQS